jgi:hypothetical protein
VSFFDSHKTGVGASLVHLAFGPKHCATCAYWRLALVCTADPSLTFYDRKDLSRGRGVQTDDAPGAMRMQPTCRSPEWKSREMTKSLPNWLTCCPNSASNRKVRAILSSDADDLEARHPVIVRVLRNYRKVMGDRGRSDPGIVQGHRFTLVAKGKSQSRPCVRYLGVDRQGVEPFGAS